MDNSPLSAMHEGARTATGGVLTFALGVVVGTTLALVIESGHSPASWWGAGATVFLVPYAIGKLWGLLLIPLYGVLLYGLVWREWSRFLCFPVLAMATSVVVLISLRGGPFWDSGTARRFVAAEGMLGAMLVGGVLLGRARNGPTS